MYKVHICVYKYVYKFTSLNIALLELVCLQSKLRPQNGSLWNNLFIAGLWAKFSSDINKAFCLRRHLNCYVSDPPQAQQFRSLMYNNFQNHFDISNTWKLMYPLLYRPSNLADTPCNNFHNYLVFVDAWKLIYPTL